MMADRNIVTFEEERNEHGPHWTLEIDRSAAGQPGLFFTIKSQMHDRAYDKLDNEMTVVVKDGIALLAPVLSWLSTEDLVEEICKSEAIKDGIDWSFLTSEQKVFVREVVRNALNALVRVGQQRLTDQYKVGI
jgi:hypothetical protein